MRNNVKKFKLFSFPVKQNSTFNPYIVSMIFLFEKFMAAAVCAAGQ
jgi:hypothetical protein